MGKNQFCVLPYLKLDKELSTGAFTIWESTPENWMKYFRQHKTGFLEMYVDKDINPIRSIPVLSCQLLLSYNDWQTFISVFFFLVTGVHLGFAGLYSENFYFEVWEFDGDNSNGGYTRLDKFVRKIVSSQAGEKILPSQFVNWNNKISIDTQSKEFTFFESEISKGLNSSLLRSLVFYMRTQFKDPNQFPEQADLQNYCSAFQCLLEVADRRNVGRVIADKLVNQLNLPAENKKQIKEWMEDLYEVRSM